MKKKPGYHALCVFLPFQKILRTMKVFALLTLLSITQIFAAGVYSQNAKISLNHSRSTVSDVLNEIEQETEFNFFYNNLIDVNREVEINVENTDIYEVLDMLFGNTDVSYVVRDKHIILSNQIDEDKIQDEGAVTGKVTDDSGSPIPGATVVIRGTTTGTVTDINGDYTIAGVENDNILVFSFVGMSTIEIPVQGKTIINAQLVNEAIGLDEVVAIGYGVQKKKLVTGATVQVDGESLAKRNAVDAFAAMQSMAPGATIVQKSGQPGEGYKVTIRGLGTIGSPDPLYVIDGVAGGSIEALNPSDIESIDILKDAASAAIYGARAANGVILVSTKKGKKGAFTVNYDGYAGVQNPNLNGIETLNAKQYMETVNLTRVASGTREFKFDELIPNHYQDIMDGKWDGTNWLEESLNRNAPVQNHSVNISGGSDMSRISMGFSYFGQEGTVGKSATPIYDRYTVRLNSDHSILTKNGRDIITVGENVSFSAVKKSGLNIQGIYSNNIRDLLVATPLLPAYNSDGDYYVYKDMLADDWDFDQTFSNPLAKIHVNHGNKTNDTKRLQANAFIEISPWENFKFRSNAGYQFYHNDYRQYVPVYELASDDSNLTDDIRQTQSYSTKWTLENTVNYIAKFDDNLFDILAGQSLEKWGYGNTVSVKNSNSLFPGSFTHAYIDNSQGINTTDTEISGAPNSPGALSSFFGRVNYNYRETYMASLVMRVDGSSNFARGHRWGFFPSVSAGWVITNESFMESVTDVMDFLKLRASWGQNGNSSIDNFQYLATISFTGDSEYYFNDKDNPSTGAYPDILPNKEVTWETSEQIDLGFDARFFDSRMGLVFDWYKKSTIDWLVVAPQLASYGTGAPYINGGDVLNKGFELALSWHDRVGEFAYDAGISMAKNENEVTRIANEEGIIHGPENVIAQNTDELYRVEVGFPMGYFWGFKTDGVFQNQQQIDEFINNGGVTMQSEPVPGDLIFVDITEDGILDDDDKTMIGNPHPKITLGLNFNVSYKGFDISMNAYGALGHQIAKSYREFSNRPNHNYTTDVYTKYWTGEGSTNRYPRFSHGKDANFNDLSDIYIEDADYLKLSNISLGYDFKRIFNRLPFRKCRVYVSAQNMLTITNYSGFDPEVGYGDSKSWASGIDVGYYPSPKTVLGGINIVF